MTHLVILAVVAVVAAAQAAKLEHVQLPEGAALAGGADGLLAPHARSDLLRYENHISADSYHYAFETSDGTKVEQDGHVEAGALPDEGSLKVSGAYSYVGADGRLYSVSYTADERGFLPAGEHLPTPPSLAPLAPLAPQLLTSLQLADIKHDQYSSHKSSYDADAGL